MATFAYIARDAAGQKVEGRLAGASAQAVLAELQSRQLAPVTVKEVRDQPRVQRKMPVRALSGAYRQLADLLRAGVPLLRALRLLGGSKSNPRLAKVMTKIADSVSEGSRLADAMAAHPDVFPPIQIAMVRAGERGGFLEPLLQRMATFLENQADMRSRVLGNLIYPCVLLTFGTGVVAAALVFFVPKFKNFYERIDKPLPTRILLATSDLLSSYWPVVLGAMALAVLGIWRLRQNPQVRRRMAEWQMRLPTMGPLVKSLAVGRFTRILGTLLENGIPMLQAMAIAREAAGNVLLAEAIERATEAVRSGETLAAPLAQSGLFSDDVIEMISVGESANNLPQVLVTIADTVEKRIDRLLALFIRLMEPALLMCLGAAVLFIFIALILPMMRMSSSLSH